MSASLSRIAIVGAGPGGLLLASLIAQSIPQAEVTVFERNRKEDVFGFGVVFSDATLRKIDEADSTLRSALTEAGTHWDRIEVWSKGERHGFSGNGMSAIHRKALLRRLQQSAESAGADVRYATAAPPLHELRASYDLVVGADGTNSTTRQQLEAQAPLGHSIETATAKFIWFATTHLFDGLTFIHRVTGPGNFAAHAYPISDELSTFIVETDEDTFARADLDTFDVSQPPGPSDEYTQHYLEWVFRDDLQGAELVGNNSRWGNFRTRRTENWGRDNVVLLGDAVHTAHFSVGSGTKMAMEDAIELAAQLTAVSKSEKDLDIALSDYVANARIPVNKVQTAAIPSLSWWEHFGLYQRSLAPTTFAFHFFSRSIGIDKIAQRDPQLATEVRDDWQRRHGTSVVDTPIEIAGVDLAGRMLEMTVTAGVATLHDRHGASAVTPCIEVSADAVAADVDDLMDLLPSDGAVVIDGPPILARQLLAEQARLTRGLTVVLAGDDVANPVAAETMILAGRADATAVENGDDQ
jgi:anthraniloyl-CoA monooxygenase